MADRFVHLHVHSDMSQLDGCARIEDYVQEAAERGDPALAVTDHGTMRGALALTAACDKAGINPVYGIELYVCGDINRRGLTDEEKAAAITGIGDNKTAIREAIKAEEQRRGVRELRHLTAWALDNDGLRNLYQLTSKSWQAGFYYKPRVDLQLLAEYHKGLAIGTGCVGSVVYKNVIEGRVREADQAFGRLHDIFGSDRLFVEVMPHDLDEQRAANDFALLVRAMGKHRLIATQDAHYLHADAAEHHDVLLAIEAHDSMGNPERFRFKDVEYWLKTRNEMAESFGRYHPYMAGAQVNEALSTTVELAQQCRARIRIDPLKCLLPEVPLPEGFANPYGYLVQLVTEGMQRRDLAARAEDYADQTGISFNQAMRIYVERMQRELKVLRDSGFASYFLVILDMYRFAEQRGIAHGPGRGSAAGSLVSYLLGITDIDPIQHRLMFERFIAPGRIDMPDVDCDFADARRGEIIEYLRERYGADRVAQISTIGRMAGRQALKDVARVYEIPFQRANVAAGTIKGGEEDHGAIETALDRSEFLRDFQAEYPEAVRHAIALEGLAKSLGIHPAGVVVAPEPLASLVPLETRRSGNKGQVVTAYDMRGVESVGLLKIDVLGLRAVTVLEDARLAISEKDGRELIYADLPLDDERTLQAFTDRDFVGIFQFDTPSSYSVCDGLKFVAFDDIVVVNAINRPGALAFADEFKRRRNNPTLLRRHLFHPKVTEITKDALGLMIYQEHVIKIAVQVAGLTPAAADKLRKKIGKSEGYEALEVDRKAFVNGCCKTAEDMDRDTADRLFDAVVKFGRYGFNRSHSVCYSMLAYWLMYLKQHRPLEFYWAVMAREPDSSKIQRLARDAKLRGVAIMLPDVNVSGASFTIDYQANAVRSSLIDIKGVGEAAVGEIVSKREAGGPFTNLIDFLQRVKGKKVTKRTVSALAQSAALDTLLPNPRWFVLNIDQVWKDVEKNKPDQVRMALERSAKMQQWSEEMRLIEAGEVNPLANPPHPLIVWEPWFATNVKVPLSMITPEVLGEEQHVYLSAVVIEVEERLVGDTKSIAEFPDKAKQKALGWGKPWARMTIEDVEGGRSWVKIDWTLVPTFRKVIDQGVGSLVMVCARTRPDWQNFDAHYLASVEQAAEKLKRDPGELSIWERLFIEQYHPATTYRWESKSDRRLALLDMNERAAKATGSVSVIGVVSHLFTRPDKRCREMAFFGVAGLRSYLNVMCFSSAWEQLGPHLKPGVFARFKLTLLDGGAFHLEAKHDAIRLLQRGFTYAGNKSNM